MQAGPPASEGEHLTGRAGMAAVHCEPQNCSLRHAGTVHPLLDLGERGAPLGLQAHKTQQRNSTQQG